MTDARSSDSGTGTHPPDLSGLHIDRSAQRPWARRGGVLWIRLVVLALVLGTLWLFRAPLLALLGRHAPAAAEQVTVVVPTPGAGGAGEVSANGYLVANRTASLATILSGRLVELNVEVGDEVAPGKVLARIQHDDLDAALAEAQQRAGAAKARAEQARAALESSRARMVQAQAGVEVAIKEKERSAVEIEVQARLASEAHHVAARWAREVERSRALLREDRLEKAVFDEVDTRARAAEDAEKAARARHREALKAAEGAQAEVARSEAAALVAAAESRERERAIVAATRDVGVAEAAVRFAAVQVEKSYIRTPFRGLVIRKDAEVGEVIAPMGAGNSRGSVVTVVDLDSIEVQVELNERRIMKVKEGGRATVFLDADPTKGWPARVRKVWPRADRSKGTIEVRVAFDGQRPPYGRPDMAARAVFHESETRTAADTSPLLPASVVVREGNLTYVWVVKEDRLRRQEVAVESRPGDRVAVRRGLTGGEVILLRPRGTETDGDAVGGSRR